MLQSVDLVEESGRGSRGEEGSKKPGRVRLGERQRGKNGWELRGDKSRRTVRWEVDDERREAEKRTMQSPKVRVEDPAAMDERIEVYRDRMSTGWDCIGDGTS